MVTTITVSGKLSDFGAQSLADKLPELEFVPSGVAFGSGNSLLGPDRKRIVPDSDGTFLVDLAITEGLTPDAWYTVVIHWVAVGGTATFPGKLRVPITGGTLQQIVEASLASSYVAVSETKPTVAFLYWYQPSSGNLYPWIGA
jgi:hypothetical protein